jgi:hypothetical protein
MNKIYVTGFCAAIKLSLRRTLVRFVLYATTVNHRKTICLSASKRIKIKIRMVNVNRDEPP